MEYTGDEIAVVGLAGRFPAAPDVPTLWRNLLDGVDAVHDHTVEELRSLGVGESLIADPTHVRGHGRLAGVADFDADFFDVPEAEARAMDPQQRLFLEQSWVALQDAAVDPTDGERAVGVFAGASANRYFLFRLLARQAGEDRHAEEDWEERLASRWAPDYLPTQVAYRLGLTGPAIAVQTACSSSLVAVCTAAQSLLDFRCDVALAGGVSVTEPRFRHTPGGLVSPDGRCRAFDAAGQGSGYGSGVAVVVLERLADALERGAQVHAVLRGWAVNNDGSARAGFAVPGLDGQVAVVTEAMASTSVTGADIGYVEAHGSGTLVGDAIEVASLTQAFGEAAGSCALGSVKTNLGNLDAAAGAAGLIKAVLAVKHATIPANLHHDVPNPEIDFAGGPFFVPVKTTEWTRSDRLAGVSSFGLGGTNAHVIVEQPPVEDPREDPVGPRVLVVSARTPDALRSLAARLGAHLAAEPGLRLDDVAHTLASRQRYACRVSTACGDITSAIAWLDRVAAGGGSAGEDSAGEGSAGRDAAVVDRPDVDGPDADVDRTLRSGRVVSLPHHPLQPRRHWIEVSS
ncbi:acyl transferase domain-containing protein [Saccharothrix tamanrassetensis]|uniref:Acyl transferase domain-containing protein n=1 Tax=Saccharothrix tamanrassetensis TaxID=1051531 RepID=A0A841CQH0_9PSEU|nr:polyketide synthase [Saccharothrix tamanrassetensis]MBB5958245.1 acyl transferase domain-containing protein [Saccharothrix tamanrassetensis]